MFFPAVQKLKQLGGGLLQDGVISMDPSPSIIPPYTAPHLCPELRQRSMLFLRNTSLQMLPVRLKTQFVSGRKGKAAMDLSVFASEWMLSQESLSLFCSKPFTPALCPESL